MGPWLALMSGVGLVALAAITALVRRGAWRWAAGMALVVGAASVLLGAAIVAMRLYSPEPRPVLATAASLAATPFAERIVIGDSRVAEGQPQGALLLGYAGATIADLVPLVGIACPLARGEVVIALGVNDALLIARDWDRAAAGLDAMAKACDGRPLAFAQAWPVEGDKRPQGPLYDAGAVDRVNRLVAAAAERAGAGLIRVPDPVPATRDGAHYGPAGSRRYIAILSSTPVRE